MQRNQSRVLTIVSILALPFTVSAFFEQGQNVFVLVWEAGFGLLCLTALLRNRQRSFERIALLAAVSCLFIADTDFNIRTMVGYHQA